MTNERPIDSPDADGNERHQAPADPTFEASIGTRAVRAPVGAIA